MFLFTSKGKENIPKGAVIVSEKEAIAHQRDIVRDWDKESQVQVLISSQ